MKKKMLVCLLCAVSATVFFTGCEKAEAPDQVVKHYFETLTGTGNILAVKPYLSPDSVLQLEILEGSPDIVKAMPQIMEEQKNLWKDVEFSYSTPEGNAERMKVIVTATYKDAKYSTPILLFFINGKWVISNYSFNSNPDVMRFVHSIAVAKGLIQEVPAAPVQIVAKPESSAPAEAAQPAVKQEAPAPAEAAQPAAKQESPAPAEAAQPAAKK